MKKTLTTFILCFSLSVFAGTKQEAEEASNNEEYQKAFLIWNEFAEKGDIDAQYWVANFYQYGKGVEKNNEKAAFWYLKAASGGEVTSQYNVGYLYFNGIGVTMDLKQSARWFKKAADRENVDAQYAYGYQLLHGEGVKKDLTTAYVYFKKAALGGNVYAQNNMGLFLTDIDLWPFVRKIEKNKSFFDVKKIGMRWLRLAADAGIQDALKNINALNAIKDSSKRLGDMIGKAQTGISSNDDATYARPGIFKLQDQKRTKYGDIGVFNEKNKSSFIYKKEFLNPSIQAKNLVSIDEVIQLNNIIYILVMIDEAEKDCYGNFRWITLSATGVNPTESFGNCSGIADVILKDGKLMITKPKKKNNPTQNFSFEG